MTATILTFPSPDHRASFEIIGEPLHGLVLIDGIVPVALAETFALLVQAHNTKFRKEA